MPSSADHEFQPVLATAGDMLHLGMALIPGNEWGDRVHNSWPPPGLSTIPSVIGGRPPYCFLVGNPEGLQDGHWWTTHLGTIVSGLSDIVPDLEERVALWFTRRTNPVVGTWAAWPVIYKHGEGQFMRWIHSIVKGTLGGVEEFQFGFNWGKPGDDPDPSEVEIVAMGDALAAHFVSASAGTDAGLGGAIRRSVYSADVVFTEHGIQKLTQTDPTELEGGGGNLEQAFETHWSPFNGVTGLVGTGSEKSLPYEVSCCVTLQSEHRGPRGRGRLYLPPFSITALTTGGVYAANQAKGAASIISDWMTRVIADSPLDLLPVVVSRRGIILHPIVQVNVGIVPDSQRRRRWSQLEARQVVWEA